MHWTVNKPRDTCLTCTVRQVVWIGFSAPSLPSVPSQRLNTLERPPTSDKALYIMWVPTFFLPTFIWYKINEVNWFRNNDLVLSIGRYASPDYGGLQKLLKHVENCLLRAVPRWWLASESSFAQNRPKCKSVRFCGISSVCSGRRSCSSNKR